ncbi:type II toxin-antitoxin system RelE/ParE family toxin [Haploplasma axanthum]|uniref:Uncharacterized protein conserved in bacteria n=1 Tax=Haploplasma axanthum TaxID=29552 RepID=A0A449BC35_HAPAX|nr:type II toxin-antitoxin system RelE/ParE family toxin [Haploplasma axanthum]VEU79996.1 Uncharacterized protein conserved in bacteria [Haploplasma axanthum]
MAELVLIEDTSTLTEIFDNYIFNIDSDIKYFSTCNANNQKKLSSHILSCCNKKQHGDILLGNKSHVFISKLRIPDECSNKGKRSGYRCIILVDLDEAIIFLLHLYSKSKKKNLDKKEEKNLERLLSEYLDNKGE